MYLSISIPNFKETTYLRSHLLKTTALLLLFTSNLMHSQEYKNLRAYQKETKNTFLLEGCWLKKDRKTQSEVWKRANKYNLTQENGNSKYLTIREIRDFYLWFDEERKQQGHEIQWIGIAAMATNQLSKLEIGFYRIFIVRNEELVQFGLDGSKKVFSDAFPKLKKVYFSNQLIKGCEAEYWDREHGFNEQCYILNPIYSKLSQKAFKKLERMAKGKGIFRIAISKKLMFEGDLNSCETRVLYGIEKLLPIYLKKHN